MAARTLSIDVGGTRLKAGILDETGHLVAGPARTDTPHPAPPRPVIAALLDIIRPLGEFDRVSVGFPGVVRRGQVFTAPNLDTPSWRGFRLASELERELGHPVRVLNDAEVQGLGVIDGRGLECVITLGTGMGFALFEDGRLTPHLEMGQHPVRKRATYDQYVGTGALTTIGRNKWNKRVERAIGWIETLVGYDELLIGGGNAKHITFTLPKNVRIVSNEAGITGGVQLWDPRHDSVFAR
jgi:polyphosphate glucokinase